MSHMALICDVWCTWFIDLLDEVGLAFLTMLAKWNRSIFRQENDIDLYVKIMYTLHLKIIVQVRTYHA